MNLTVEFMVTTVGGIAFGSTISARDSSASKALLPGKVLPEYVSSSAYSRSASSDEMMILGLLLNVITFLTTINQLAGFQLVRGRRKTDMRFDLKQLSGSIPGLMTGSRGSVTINL